MAAEETKAEPAPPGPGAAPGAEQEVVAFAGGLRGRRAAQLGCGAGVDCVCLAAAGCRLVVGVDADGAALAEARRRAARAEVADRCLFVEADPLAVAADELLERAAAFERLKFMRKEREAQASNPSAPGYKLSPSEGEGVVAASPAAATQSDLLTLEERVSRVERILNSNNLTEEQWLNEG